MTPLLSIPNHDMANANEPSTATPTPPTCPKCGIRPCRTDNRGEFDDLCDPCERERLDEIHRVTDRYERFPDECCCETFLGRECCKAPAHGDWWRVNAISDGERFYYIIRARDRNEALAIGREMCLDNGEECTSVTRARDESGAAA